MNAKMKAKQEVVGGFDLTAFADAGEGEVSETPVVKRKVGHPPKPKKERLSEVVQVKLSPGEMTKLKKKAGLVPLSIYLRHHLTEQGVI